MPNITPIPPNLLGFLKAQKWKANGSTKFCICAAWNDLNGNQHGFKKILGVVMEFYTTIGIHNQLICLLRPLIQLLRLLQPIISGD
ncbi:hypothetical protein MJO29_000298 [Puccinia striiformis f. sp. tritici]|nr:hypothetical protein MJO29_000298 [Puccinia striiformis f. sp. tritici]